MSGRRSEGPVRSRVWGKLVIEQLFSLAAWVPIKMKQRNAILTPLNKLNFCTIYVKLFVDSAKEMLARGPGARSTFKQRVAYFGLALFSPGISKPGIKDRLKPGSVQQSRAERVLTKLSFW